MSTVSHVVNGTRSVADATRERVLTAIEETGYRQNVLARSMRRARTDSVGLVVSDAGQPVFAEMIRGVEREAAAAGHTLLLANSDEDSAHEVRSLRALMARKVDGLIVAPAAHSSNVEVESVRAQGTPVVVMDRISSEFTGDQVGVANATPMGELVEHLLGHGYRDIALAAGDLAVATIAERHRGYVDALQAAGIEPEPTRVLIGSGLAGEIRAAATELLRHSPPEAVVCASTESTVGVMQAAAELGLQIPQDLKLAVFDGFPHGDLFEPRLTTVEQPAAEVGACAMRMLLRRMVGGDSGGGEVVRLTSRVIYRSSCGCSK